MKRSKHIKQKSCTHFNMFPNSLYLLPGLRKTLKRSILSLLIILDFLCFSTQGRNKMVGGKKQFLVNTLVKWLILKTFQGISR